MCPVGDLAERATKVAAGTAGGIVTPAVMAVFALAGLTTGDPLLIAASTSTAAFAGAGATIFEVGGPAATWGLYRPGGCIHRRSSTDGKAVRPGCPV
jgi:hypothetical protein